MKVGRRIQEPAKGAPLCDVFNDCLSICCSVSSCSVVEAETCSSGSGRASFDEPLQSRFDSARDRGASSPWHADEPCMPEVLESASRPSAVQVQPKQRSPFEMKRSLLRAVPTDVVLRGCTRLLSSSAGSEATYQCSTPTDHLEAFISHNCSVSLTKKWVALSVHFNFLSALFCGVLTAVALCVATSFGWLPLPAVDALFGKHLGLCCTVGGSLAFHFVLLFGSDVLPARIVRRHHVFLDKACIHQVDKTLQRQGIESLGGFKGVDSTRWRAS